MQEYNQSYHNDNSNNTGNNYTIHPQHAPYDAQHVNNASNHPIHPQHVPYDNQHVNNASHPIHTQHPPYPTINRTHTHHQFGSNIHSPPTNISNDYYPTLLYSPTPNYASYELLNSRRKKRERSFCNSTHYQEDGRQKREELRQRHRRRFNKIMNINGNKKNKLKLIPYVNNNNNNNNINKLLNELQHKDTTNNNHNNYNNISAILNELPDDKDNNNNNNNNNNINGQNINCQKMVEFYNPKQEYILSTLNHMENAYNTMANNNINHINYIVEKPSLFLNEKDNDSYNKIFRKLKSILCAFPDVLCRYISEYAVGIIYICNNTSCDNEIFVLDTEKLFGITEYFYSNPINSSTNDNILDVNEEVSIFCAECKDKIRKCSFALQLDKNIICSNYFIPNDGNNTCQSCREGREIYSQGKQVNVKSNKNIYSYTIDFNVKGNTRFL